MADRVAGKLITFYSYKGGTGRSMALANFACWLGRRLAPGRRVLMLDWDLEAPGLHRYFPQTAELAENAARPGLIQYFGAVRARLDAEPELYARLAAGGGARVMREAFPLDDYLVREVAPGVDLLKAGGPDPDYAQLVSAFDWVGFYEQYGAVFDALRELVAADYAYGLIDSRTGFNDTSGICTMLMPEKLVLVFTPNRQNLAGVIDIAWRAVEYRRGANDFRPLSVFPLPSRIENAEQELKKIWRDEYEQTFEATLKNIYRLDSCDLEGYFNAVLLPHVSFYAYGEELALLREEHRDALSLGGAYESFFGRLDGQEFAWDSPGDAEPREEQPPLPYKPPRSFSEGFENDIYISYARVDNAKAPGESEGWVDVFHEWLEVELARWLGRRGLVKIWRDTRMLGPDIFDATVSQKIAASRLFIPILSRGYLNSDYCMGELEEFRLQAGARGGGLVDDRSNILPVHIQSLPSAELPNALARVPGYRFHGRDGYGPPYRPEAKAFGEMMSRLVHDISVMIRTQLDSPPVRGAAAEPPPEGPAVYLAEATDDLSDLRDRIRERLQAEGLKVLPEHYLMLGDGAFVSDTVASYLRRCSLSVHLVGGFYGRSPAADEPRSLTEFQFDLAAERGGDPEFTQVVWVSPAAEPAGIANADQRAFVGRLLGGDPARKNLTLLRSPVGSVGYDIVETVQTRLRASVEQEPLSPVVVIDLYRKDMQTVSQLIGPLTERNYEVRIMPLGDSPRTTFERFETVIRGANVYVLLLSGVAVEWARERLSSVLQIATRDKTSLKLCVVYATPGKGHSELWANISPSSRIPVFLVTDPVQLGTLLDRVI